MLLHCHSLLIVFLGAYSRNAAVEKLAEKFCWFVRYLSGISRKGTFEIPFLSQLKRSFEMNPDFAKDVVALSLGKVN